MNAEDVPEPIVVWSEGSEVQQLPFVGPRKVTDSAIALPGDAGHQHNHQCFRAENGRLDLGGVGRPLA